MLSEVELKATAEELSTLGQCIALPSNLASLDGVNAFAAAIRERESRLHILVNNAGASWGAPIDEFPESGWDKVMDLNVKSLFFLTRELLPVLRAAGNADDPARVINIGSMNGITHPHMDNYSYSASKAAVHHLTRHLGADLLRGARGREHLRARLGPVLRREPALYPCEEHVLDRHASPASPVAAHESVVPGRVELEADHLRPPGQYHRPDLLGYDEHVPYAYQRDHVGRPIVGCV